MLKQVLHELTSHSFHLLKIASSQEISYLCVLRFSGFSGQETDEKNGSTTKEEEMTTFDQQNNKTKKIRRGTLYSFLQQEN